MYSLYAGLLIPARKPLLNENEIKISMQNLAVLKTDELPAENRTPRFQTVIYQNSCWDLSHLDSYGFVHHINDLPVLVIVVFSCHCFTRSATNEEMARDLVHPDHWYDDGREKRVLDEERYQLSRKYLPRIVHELGQRKITIADERRRNGNFLTIEIDNLQGEKRFYSVFFEISKEKKQRLILRVQSAYVRDVLPARENKAKPVRLHTLLKAVFEGRKIKA